MKCQRRYCLCQEVSWLDAPSQIRFANIAADLLSVIDMSCTSLWLQPGFSSRKCAEVQIARLEARGANLQSLNDEALMRQADLEDQLALAVQKCDNAKKESSRLVSELIHLREHSKVNIQIPSPVKRKQSSRTPAFPYRGLYNSSLCSISFWFCMKDWASSQCIKATE